MALPTSLPVARASGLYPALTDRRPTVIVVSAVAGMEDRMHAEDLGVGHFLAKPFEIEDLLRLVREAPQPA